TLSSFYCVSFTSSAFLSVFFFFNDPAPADIYTLSLHDALPILVSTATATAWGTRISSRGLGEWCGACLSRRPRMRRSGAQGGCSRPGTGDGEYGRAALAPPSLFAFFEVGLREAPMTVAEMQELFAYNAWANRRCFAALEPLPAEAYFRDLKSSHGGLHGTMCHIVWAEQLWLNRWLANPNPAVPQGRDLTTLAAARTRWEPIEPERA